jgi:hypothetical protein
VLHKNASVLETIKIPTISSRFISSRGPDVECPFASGARSSGSRAVLFQTMHDVIGNSIAFSNPWAGTLRMDASARCYNFGGTSKIFCGAYWGGNNALRNALLAPKSSSATANLLLKGRNPSCFKIERNR